MCKCVTGFPGFAVCGVNRIPPFVKSGIYGILCTPQTAKPGNPVTHLHIAAITSAAASSQWSSCTYHRSTSRRFDSLLVGYAPLKSPNDSEIGPVLPCCLCMTTQFCRFVSGTFYVLFPELFSTYSKQLRLLFDTSSLSSPPV